MRTRLGEQQQRQQEQQRIGEVVGGWKKASSFTPNGTFERRMVGRSFFGHLDRALGPAELLALKRVHLDGQLGGRDDIRQVDKLPAAELCAIRKIHVLGQRVVLPAARVLDG